MKLKQMADSLRKWRKRRHYDRRVEQLFQGVVDKRKKDRRKK